MKLSGYLHGQTLKGVSNKFEKMGFSLNKKLSSKEISILDKINGGVIERVRIKRDFKCTLKNTSWIWAGGSKKEGVFFECFEIAGA